jgi:hypothetical protein
VNRHVPLVTRTPLRRTGGPRRVAGLNPRRRRHVASNTPVTRTTRDEWEALRALIWNRCEGYCEKCDAKLNPAWWDAHHRLMRSQGGRDEAPNLVALHPACHTLHAGAVHEDTGAAYARGLLIRFALDMRTGCHLDPRKEPLLLPGGRRVRLTHNGAYEEVAA